MSKKAWAVISLIFVVLAWGSSYSVTKLAVMELPPVYFAFLRFCVASVILILILVTTKKRRGPKPPMFIITLMALSGITFFYLFFNFSLKYTSASMGALLEGFIPVFVAVMAAVFLKEKLRLLQVVGIMISVGGIVLVGFVSGPAHNASNPLLGNLLMMVSIFLWALYTILSKKVASFDPLVVITYTTVIGTLFLFPMVLIELQGKSWPMPSLPAWLSIIYLGAIASALSYFLYSKALRELTAAQVGNFLNLDPLTGALLAIIFLHEKLMLWQVIGCTLVLTGVWLSTKASAPKNNE